MVESPTNEILASLEFSAEKGEIRFNDIRYILMRPETLVSFQKIVEAELGSVASDLMFKAAYDIGIKIGIKYVKSGRSKQEVVKSMLETTGKLGWAKLGLKSDSNLDKRVILSAFNSAFASAYGPSRNPVCDFIRGIFAGALSEIVGPLRESREIECMSMGKHECIFEFTIQEEKVGP